MALQQNPLFDVVYVKFFRGFVRHNPKSTGIFGTGKALGEAFSTSLGKISSRHPTALGYSRKYPHTPHGRHWKSVINAW